MEKGVCKLCGNHGDLRRSHIIPEAFFTSVYEKEEHQFFSFSNKSTERGKRRRKGLREPLLCPACEDITMIYDDYAVKIWNGNDKTAQYHPYGNGLEVSGIDYTKMKLFFIVTLWRAGVSTLPDFSTIKLGEKHEAILRKMILENNPGRQHEYAVLLLAARKDPLIRDILLHHISILGTCKVEGHTAYRFIIGGFMWCLFVSSHLKGTLVDQYCSLKENGELWIYEKNEHVENIMRGAFKKMHFPADDRH
jgi:hypothetical protein